MGKVKWMYLFHFYEISVHISICSGDATVETRAARRNRLMPFCLFVDLIPFPSNLMFIDKYLQV